MAAAGQILRTRDIERLIGWVAIDNNSSTVTSSTDIVAYTMSNVTLENGRAFKVGISALYNLTVAASNRGTIRVRKTNAAGTIYIDFHQLTSTTNAINYPFSFTRYMVNTSGADITTDLAITISQAAGTGGFDIRGSTTTACGYWGIWDVGSSDDYPGMSSFS